MQQQVRQAATTLCTCSTCRAGWHRLTCRPGALPTNCSGSSRDGRAMPLLLLLLLLRRSGPISCSVVKGSSMSGLDDASVGGGIMTLARPTASAGHESATSSQLAVLPASRVPASSRSSCCDEPTADSNASASLPVMAVSLAVRLLLCRSSRDDMSAGAPHAGGHMLLLAVPSAAAPPGTAADVSTHGGKKPPLLLPPAAAAAALRGPLQAVIVTRLSRTTAACAAMTSPSVAVRALWPLKTTSAAVSDAPGPSSSTAWRLQLLITSRSSTNAVFLPGRRACAGAGDDEPHACHHCAAAAAATSCQAGCLDARDCLHVLTHGLT